MPQYAIKSIKPNPFRHIERYPIRREKVAALRESFRKTGFWGNIVARDVNGSAEIAYGHHRLFALRDEYGPNHKVDLLVHDLSDDLMLQIMARENLEEWGTTAAVEHETVRAVVQAFAEGRVHLPPVSGKIQKSQIRYAPSFVPGVEPPGDLARRHPYTVQGIANFIGWCETSGEPQHKVYDALAALQFIEEGLLKESDFDGLTTAQARAVITEARKARERGEAIARTHRLQAERAAREAAEAHKRKQEAERQRQQREAEAAAARTEEARRRAQAEAERLERQRIAAETARQRAQKRQQTAERHAQEQKLEGQRLATSIGRAVSREIRAGTIGYKRASEIATKLEGKRDEPPPDIEDVIRRLMTEVNKILRAEADPRAARLDEIVKFRDYLSDLVRKDAAQTLRQAARRFHDYADALWPEDRAVSAAAERRLVADR